MNQIVHNRTETAVYWRDKVTRHLCVKITEMCLTISKSNSLPLSFYKKTVTMLGLQMFQEQILIYFQCALDECLGHFYRIDRGLSGCLIFICPEKSPCCHFTSCLNTVTVKQDMTGGRFVTVRFLL